MKSVVNYTLHKKISWKFICAMAVLLLMALFILLAGWGGIRTYTVLSGSMEPEIPTGTLLFVHPVKPEKVKPGDVITFSVGGDMTATHRVVSVREHPDGISFQTKGDANAAVDGKPVHESQIIGSPVFSVPGAGYLIWFLQRYLIFLLIAGFGIKAVLFLRVCIEENTAETGKYLRR